MSELYISREYGGSDESGIRIEVRKGPTLLARVEVSMEGFAKAIMGQGAVPVQFSTQRDSPGRRAPRE